jgi:D-glycero-D-manno-heptose 1,7-bisphosphate phosphatase
MGIGGRRGCHSVNSALQRRAVFLDRDGVLIHAIVRDNKPYAVTLPHEIRIIDGVPDACEKLSQLGFLLVMVTNQPDVARGKVAREFVEETNAMLASKLHLDDVETCFHDNSDDCDCRKPNPGLLTAAARKLSIDLNSSIVVGDRWRDVEAGRRAGCKVIFIDYGYDEPLRSVPDHNSKSLLDAVGWIQKQI